MKAILQTLTAICLAFFCASGCRQQSYGSEDKSKIHAGIVFDIGGKDDRSFNAGAWNGVHCAETGKWPDGKDCGKPGT